MKFFAGSYYATWTAGEKATQTVASQSEVVTQFAGGASLGEDSVVEANYPETPWMWWGAQAAGLFASIAFFPDMAVGMLEDTLLGMGRPPCFISFLKAFYVFTGVPGFEPLSCLAN